MWWFHTWWLQQVLNEELLVLLVHQPNLHTGGANLGKFANVVLKIKWNIMTLMSRCYFFNRFGHRISCRKWREIKQQQCRARSGHLISNCLVSLHSCGAFCSQTRYKLNLLLHGSLWEKLPTLDTYSTAQPDDMYDVADEAELQEVKDKKHPWTAPGEDSRNL